MLQPGRLLFQFLEVRIRNITLQIVQESGKIPRLITPACFRLEICQQPLNGLHVDVQQQQVEGLALQQGRFDVVHGFEPGLPSISYLALRDSDALAVASFFSPERLGYPPRRALREKLLATSAVEAPRISVTTATAPADPSALSYGGMAAAAAFLALRNVALSAAAVAEPVPAGEEVTADAEAALFSDHIVAYRLAEIEKRLDAQAKEQARGFADVAQSRGSPRG